jgi:hypothetical protein
MILLSSLSLNQRFDLNGESPWLRRAPWASSRDALSPALFLFVMKASLESLEKAGGRQAPVPDQHTHP